MVVAYRKFILMIAVVSVFMSWAVCLFGVVDENLGLAHALILGLSLALLVTGYIALVKFTPVESQSPEKEELERLKTEIESLTDTVNSLKLAVGMKSTKLTNT